MINDSVCMPGTDGAPVTTGVHPSGDLRKPGTLFETLFETR
jgi:hypothetical protein